MTSIADLSVTIQTSPQSVPTTPCWFGEVALLAHFLRHQGVFALIEERVRFARRRFGHYDVIDFVAVLLGYASSGERTLEAFYERLQPFAPAFMALFGRNRLPARSSALPLSCGAGSSSCRGVANAVSRRSGGSLSGAGGATGWAVGSTGNPLARLRCRWDAARRSPTSFAKLD
jgi:hypothetical protein